jgi:2-oxoacid:acceptor oxidoreductase gamma subunit (pyruvate/2-ketoisovalerate family)/2-oxoacid:acceptor oxidoreductase delta subunit (pyruvate/2-ketoisovalerate family)
VLLGTSKCFYPIENRTATAFRALGRDSLEVALIEIRFHGRGGQGAVTAVKILASAIYLEGKYTQAIPMYGTERRGAPVAAFCRVDDTRIRERDLVHEPDIVVVLDPLLNRSVDVTDGLKKGGLVIVNHPGSAKDTGLAGDFRVSTVDATKIALDVIGRPITNTAILGAFAKATGIVTIDSLAKSLSMELSDRLIPKNVEAMKKAYEETSAPVDASGFKKAEMVKKVSTQPLISYSRNVADWRVMRPVVDKAKCVGCKRCWVYCPETAIEMKENKAEINYDYCKGCAICSEECLVGAVKMVREEV